MLYSRLDAGVFLCTADWTCVVVQLDVVILCSFLYTMVVLCLRVHI